MSDETPERLRAVLVAVQTPDIENAAFAASIAELKRLGRTLGVDVVETVTQRRASLHPGTVLGSGKLATLQALAGVSATGADEDGETAGEEDSGGTVVPLEREDHEPPVETSAPIT